MVILNWLARASASGSIHVGPTCRHRALPRRHRARGAVHARALVSRRIDHDPRARAVHPWIGATALLLSGVQVFLGLQLMPL
jgi:hypothetical protein